MEEISYEFDGVTYTAEYEVDGNALTVLLPNGEQRTSFFDGRADTWLSGNDAFAILCPWTSSEE